MLESLRTKRFEIAEVQNVESFTMIAVYNIMKTKLKDLKNQKLLTMKKWNLAT